MAHTSILASLNEPLLPLTDKQLQAAAESHEYAIDHELFLALDTDDHLQYHHSVAANEERRIPAAERSLAEDHLPPLVLPTTKIEELWTVSRRVADVLEAACRWLDDDELKFCEEAVVNNSARLRKARHPTSLKLEPPLLCTDPDADCAELQKLASAAVNCGESRVRQHGIPHDTDEENALFTIPQEAVDYAAQLEESVRTETMAVSEQVINSLVSLMSSMEWTEKDQAAFLEDQLTVPKLSKRYISPTLPPVELYDYYIPEGDVCLVSDASDVSSGVSEALEEAERLLAEETNDAWKESAAEFDMAAFTHAPPVSLLDSFLSQLPDPPRKHRQLENDISMSPSPILSTRIPEAVPEFITEDDKLFRDWVDESIYEKHVSPELGDENIATKKLLGKVSLDCLEAPNSIQDDLSEDSCQAANFQEMTEHSLLSLEENSIVAQAKITVPNVSIESSLPKWHSVGEHPLDMFQWILHKGTTDIVLDDWPPKAEHNEDERLFEAGINTWTEQCTRYAEKIEFDVQDFQRTTSWLQAETDIRSLLLASIKPVPSSKKSWMASEEPLETPKDKPKQPPKGPSGQIPQTFLKSRPAQEAEAEHGKAEHSVATDSWGDLMNRFKKRKSQHATSSQSQDPGDTLTMPQEHVQIKAPELILGFRAFAEPSIQTDYNNNDNNNNNNNSKGAGQDAKTVLADKNIATAAAMIQNSLAVQPIDTSISHLPRAILSTAIPRAIRSILMQLLPTLDFVERDYQQQQSSNTDINNDDEADIVVSPTTGIIVITMVGLRQTDAQRRYVFQTRVASAAQKYEQLYVFIYRSHARPVSSGAANDDLPELSPSDAMAFAQLQGFVHSLPCKVSASYVGGGEQTVAQWIATLILKLAEKYGKTKSTEAYLVEEETHEERLLRQAGFNVYDAQIALGVLKASVDRPDFKDKNGKSHIRRMMEMSSDERLQLFGTHIGCPRTLARVNQLFSERFTLFSHTSR